MTDYDRYITGGRWRQEFLVASCPCGTKTGVTAETEYGRTTLSPEECPACGDPWPDDVELEPDGPDEDAAYDRMVEDRLGP